MTKPKMKMAGEDVIRYVKLWFMIALGFIFSGVGMFVAGTLMSHPLTFVLGALFTLLWLRIYWSLYIKVENEV